MVRFLRITQALITIAGLWATTAAVASASEAEVLSPIFPAEATGIEITPSSQPSPKSPVNAPVPEVEFTPSSQPPQRSSFRDSSSATAETPVVTDTPVSRKNGNKVLSNYGLIGTLKDDQLSVLLIDGERKVYPLTKRVVSQFRVSASVGLPPSQAHLKRGKLVGFETNRRTTVNNFEAYEYVDFAHINTITTGASGERGPQRANDKNRRRRR